MLPEGGEAPAEEFRRRLHDRAPLFALPFPPGSLDRLALYLAELDRERRRTNLTGPVTADALVEHALESALGAALLPPRSRVADIGSGAGLPGFPIAIVAPTVRVLPIEPRRKRREFLDATARVLALENVEPSVPSMKKLAPGSFDAAVSRAVGGIADIVAEAPFLAPGGAFLAWTTNRYGLAESLPKSFRLERVLRIPDTANKSIALYRKSF